MSPAGEAFAMLPPSVPRFWIWAAPIVAAASTSAGTCSRHSAERRMSVYVVRAPRTSASPSMAMPRSSSMPHRSTMPAGGSPSSPVRATIRSVPPAIGRTTGAGGQRGVRLGQVARAGDGRLDRHRRSAAGRRRRARDREQEPSEAQDPEARRRAAWRDHGDRRRWPRAARGLGGGSTAWPSSGARRPRCGRWPLVGTGIRSGRSAHRGLVRWPRRARSPRRSWCSRCSGTGCRRSPRGWRPRPGRRRHRDRRGRPSASPACRSRTGRRRSRGTRPGAGRGGDSRVAGRRQALDRADVARRRPGRPARGRSRPARRRGGPCTRRTRPSPQPSLVPVSARSSRRTSSRRRMPGHVDLGRRRR